MKCTCNLCGKEAEWLESTGIQPFIVCKNCYKEITNSTALFANKMAITLAILKMGEIMKQKQVE